MKTLIKQFVFVPSCIYSVIELSYWKRLQGPEIKQQINFNIYYKKLDYDGESNDNK